ncbi:MAG: GWxTD domain-containing protein [Candidatus Aminicenantales bacterium]
MKKTVFLGPALVAFLAAAALAAVEKISPDLERWLEDVSPILTKTEKDVFLKLETNADRAKFVRFFWRMRDPLPDTSENEFQREYEERVRFADRSFGHFSPKRGSQTDRGFFYLVLGPPLERTFFTTQSQIWPLELWFYKGAEEYGLPGYFYLIFYQPNGIGDFRLYSPTVEGPEKLAVPALGSGVALTRMTALNAIKNVSSELANASLSYLPGETPMGTASFSSDSIIASVHNLPGKKFSSAYARSYMNYKDYIETEYTDNYLQSAFQVRVFRAGGQAFVHWSIEPEKMNFGTQADAIYASFELVLRIEDGSGATVFEKVEEIPLKITPEQYKAHERQRFAFQDLLAIVPGEHRAFFLLKNKTAKDFSSFETRVVVPPPDTAGRAGLGVPLLFHAREAVPEAQKNNLKAFTFGGQHYLVGARNEFIPASTLGVFVQVDNVAALGLDTPPSFVLDIILLDTNESAGIFPLTETVPDPHDAATLLVSGTAPLKDVKPGYYRAEVSVRSADGRSLLTQKENFVVLAQPVPVVPWAYSRLHGPFPGPEHLKALGSQHFLKGDYGQARDVLERTLKDRDDPGARLLLAKSLYGLGLFQESLAQAVPLYERAHDREAAKVIALDYAGLKDWSSALTHLDKLLAEATEIPVLNLAAECHLALGRPEKALPLLQKSLALVPDQPAIKALEEKTRKRTSK